jgi:hypothetical protein
MGKTVYCISNGSPDTFPENTLTSFGNKFPFSYDYGQSSNDYKLQVAVDAIGFSLNFNQQFLPKPMGNPCIIFEIAVDNRTASRGYFLKNNVIEDILFTHIEEDLRANKDTTLPRKRAYIYFHFQNSTLTMSNLKNLFNRVNTIFPTIYDTDLNTITFLNNRNDVSVYFNSKLFPFIKIKAEKSNTPITRTINTDVYEKYICNPANPLTLDFNGVFSLNLPKIIKVRCKNIRDQIFNSTHEKDLLVFCPQIDKPKDNTSNYFFHEFECRTYCTFENTILDNIFFELINEYNEPLHLDTGIPTLLKLDIIAMEKFKKSFNIRIASDKNNRSKFTVKLPQNLHFNERWKVSLSSINLPNTFNTFCAVDEHLKLVFKYQKDGFQWGKKNIFVSDGRIEYEIPNKIYTKQELLDHINKFLQENELGVNIGEITEETSNVNNKTKTKLNIRSHGLLGIPLHLLEMFGKANTEYIVDKDNYVFFMHGYAAVESVDPALHVTTIEFDGAINMDYYKPSYIMLYADFIQPIAVSGIYMNIMKIFPISPLKMSYVIKEFKNVEYLSLNNYEIKEMHFQLRNHAGDLISFENENPNPVILNLHFTNYSH